MVTVHGSKLEIGKQKLGRKRVYELDVYKLAEELSDIVWHDFDKWNKKVQNTVGYQIIRSSVQKKHEDQISNFKFQRSVNGYNKFQPKQEEKLWIFKNCHKFADCWCPCQTLLGLNPDTKRLQIGKNWRPKKLVISSFQVFWFPVMLSAVKP